MTITNIELEHLAEYFEIPNFKCVMNDEMITMPFEDGYYIVNLEDTSDDGSHWVVVIIKNGQKLYWDSYSGLPSLQVTEFFHNTNSKYMYNNRIIQDLKSVLCGWFCLGLIIFCHHFSEVGENDIYTLADIWSECFLFDYAKNDKQLKWIFKHKFDYEIPSAVKSGGDLSSVYNRVVNNEFDFSTSAKKLLDEYGDENIASMTIKRNPISIPKSVIKMAIKEMPYDELYHLYMDIKTTLGKKITIEKNQVVKLTEGISDRGGTTESINVPINKILTINEMLLNGRGNVGDSRFFKYSAKSANCQDFILNLLSSSQLLTNEADTFIKQRGTQQLFSNKRDGRKGVSRKALNVVTDVLGTIQTAFD